MALSAALRAADAGERHRQRRVAAIARTAANLASQGSLPAILDALAAEVLQTDALAAVQIVTLDATGRQLRIMGSAGFGHWPDFFDRLMECRRRGAALRMLDAFRQTEPVLVANRWAIIRDDPAWAPIREYLSELEWESFASIPMMARGQPVGILNAFFAPGQAMEPRTIEFLAAMADQAAIAVDYANLLRHTSDGARRDERQRLARDLHDSIVQQVFSISMQAKSLEVLAGRGAAAARRNSGARRGGAADRRRGRRACPAPCSPTCGRWSTSCACRRRPTSAALRRRSGPSPTSTANRTGLKFSVSAGHGLEQVGGRAGRGRLPDRRRGDPQRRAARGGGEGDHPAGHARRPADRRAVADDGQGIGRRCRPGQDTGTRDSVSPGQRDPAAGYGLTTMRERAERWGGTVTVGPGRSSGTVVRLAVPLDGGIPLAPTGPPVRSAARREAGPGDDRRRPRGGAPRRPRLP